MVSWAAQPCLSHQCRGNCSRAAASHRRPPAAFSQVPARQEFFPAATFLVFSRAWEKGYLKPSSSLCSIGSRKRFLPCRFLSKAFVCFLTVPPCLELLQNPARQGNVPLFNRVILSCSSSSFPKQKVSAPKCRRAVFWAGLWDTCVPVCLLCPTTTRPAAGNVSVTERKYRGRPSFGSPVDACCCVLVVKLRGGLKIRLTSHDVCNRRSGS